MVKSSVAFSNVIVISVVSQTTTVALKIPLDFTDQQYSFSRRYSKILPR